ncbi:MAG: GNAT family N-acetyltransferase [Nitrososphaeria archaeon]|jgi:ribosomal protein S18 acetylase RimI-like enzyme
MNIHIITTNDTKRIEIDLALGELKIGTCNCIFDNGDAVVEIIRIDKQFRRQGLATKLLRIVEALGYNVKFPEPHCVSRDGNKLKQYWEKVHVSHD